MRSACACTAFALTIVACDATPLADDAGFDGATAVAEAGLVCARDEDCDDDVSSPRST